MYSKRTVAETADYQVTVEFHGVFERFDRRRGQQGDPRGKIIIETRREKLTLRRWHNGGSSTDNLDYFDDIVRQIRVDAINKDLKIDIDALVPVLAEALSPYSSWAKTVLEYWKATGKYVPGRGGKGPD